MSPSVYSMSGIGTSNAVALARFTRNDAAGWCGSNSVPGEDVEPCIRQQLASEDGKKSYRASADCLQGRITPIDGMTYTLAGVWDNSDIGGGRT